jgi:hypothetical protein
MGVRLKQHQARHGAAGAHDTPDHPERCARRRGITLDQPIASRPVKKKELRPLRLFSLVFSRSRPSCRSRRE